MQDLVAKRFREIAPKADFVSLRLVETTSEQISLRDDILLPVEKQFDLGAMITVFLNGGLGYAATSDISKSGLESAANRALDWAKTSRGRLVCDFTDLRLPNPKGSYKSPLEKPWDAVPIKEKADILLQASARAKISDLIVNRELLVAHSKIDTLYLTADGGELNQQVHLFIPDIEVTANKGSISQGRSLSRMGMCKQGGFEHVEAIGFEERSLEIAKEAIDLLDADNCPNEKMDLLLAPDQMLLQIHESIGHPLELDRILGDERNYAGTSFVTLDMFGNYRYGSELLNVTFDPSPAQFASYAFDDEGQIAERTFIIKDGILQRPLGGAISQYRAGMDGVANSRSSGWNRPPLDRMANLNVEPGNSSFEELVSSVEKGIFMRTNLAWSIDDSRNKFQFGCEWARLIENGKLGKLVKNPNYRGISSSFWRSLKGVGNRDTFESFGTPGCGKAEPNQAMYVGHSSPACLFGEVEVFGGEK